MNLKEKTVSGLTWSFIDIISRQGIVFVIGIILARLLTPKEFGLIGMTSFFIAISNSFIDSGFGQALVRKKECTQTDYSTVYIFNLIVSVIFFVILFTLSDSISKFFNEPQLSIIIKVLATGLILKSASLIQSVILIKKIDFKLQTKVSIVSSLGSGILGIYCAYRGYGVWSLVVKSLMGFAITTFLLWIWQSWRPSLQFSQKSFKELFSFGSRLLISGLIKRIYEYVYILLIGKFFSATQVGYYTRADQFKNLFSKNLTMVIQRVSYPALASIQDENERLKSSYKILIKSTMLLTFTLMTGLWVMARPLVLTLIGEKWLPSVEYLQILCFVGILFPLQEINQNMLKVQGRSDIILKLEVFKKLLIIPVIIFGLSFGIKILLIGMCFIALFSYIADSHFAGKKIKYSFFHQIRDILPSLILSIISGGIVYFVGLQMDFPYQIELAVQLFLYSILLLGFAELFKMRDYIYLKSLILHSEIFKSRQKRKRRS